MGQANKREHPVLVHFWPHTNNPNIASYRLRCLQVMERLCRLEITARAFSQDEIPQHLVLSKRYDKRSIDKALELKRVHGTRLYLDICDNHFYYNTPEPQAISRAEQLRAAVKSVDVVIASTEFLADVIRKEAVDDIRVVVIGDLVDFPHEPTPVETSLNLFAWLKMKKLQFDLDAIGVNKQRRLVWFGNHGSGYTEGGMADLLSIRDSIEAVAAEVPISLTVISNSLEKYRAITDGWTVPTFYLPWNKAFISAALRLHGIAVIPIRLNPFTEAKTANRVTTSLAHGLSVIADKIPSYEEYAEHIYFDNWRDNILSLASTGNKPKPECSIEEFENKNTEVALQWAKLFNDIVDGNEIVH